MQHVDRDVPELGIDLLSAYQNKGYGPEAVIGFCNWYSDQNDIAKAEVRIFGENTHSRHVFEKLGAEYISSSPFLPEQVIKAIRGILPDAEVDKMEQMCIRSYVLQLPIVAE